MGVARVGLLAGILLMVPVQAGAQSDAARGAARELGGDGVKDYQAGNYRAATEKLEQAFDILRVPSLGLWSARALVKAGKLVEASERYLDTSRLDASRGDAAVQKQAQADAPTEREALQPRIPGLTLESNGAPRGVSIMLDGVAVPPAMVGVRQPANPGKHIAEARDGGRQVRHEVTLAEGQRLTLMLDWGDATVAPGAPPTGAPVTATPDPQTLAAPGSALPPAADSRKVPAGVWVGVAVAGAGLATGGIAAALAIHKKSALNCPDAGCLPSQRADANSYNQLLTISTLGFIAAGVGVATAGAFWFTRPSVSEHAAYVSPWLGLGAAGVGGAF